MEDAIRTLMHWFIQRKTFKCVGGVHTYDYALVEGGSVVAYVSYHPNGTIAKWMRCAVSATAFYWTPEGRLVRTCERVKGARHGLDIYYTLNGVIYHISTYKKGQRDGLTWDGESDCVVLYRRGRMVIPWNSQFRLNKAAARNDVRALTVGDNGDALAVACRCRAFDAAAYLLTHNRYADAHLLDLWNELRVADAASDILPLLRTYLPTTSDPLSIVLPSSDLTEANELYRAGFRPTASHLVEAATQGHSEAVQWCLRVAPHLPTHTAWVRACAENYPEVAHLLEPSVVTQVRAFLRSSRTLIPAVVQTVLTGASSSIFRRSTQHSLRVPQS